MLSKGNRSRVQQLNCFADGRQSSRFGARPETLILALLRPGSLWRQLHQFQPHLAYTRVDQANLPSYSIGYINFAPLLVGSSVINAHNLKLAIARVHNSNPRPKRQIRVCRRQTLGIEPLAVRRLLPVELGAIPAGIANPSLDRLRWLRQMSHQGRFHSRSNQEHQRHPANRGPCNEEWSSHSVFFLLLTTEKCSKNAALCQPFCTEKDPLNSLIELALTSETALANAPTMSSLALGSEKLDVPTCTAV